MLFTDFLRNLVPEFANGGKQWNRRNAAIVALPVTERYGIMSPGQRA